MLRTDAIYRVEYRDGYSYAVSPDGRGAYWYDSLGKAREDMGDIGNYPVITISQRAFDSLRD